MNNLICYRELSEVPLILKLPHEVINYIFSYLEVLEQVDVAFASSQFFALVGKNLFEFCYHELNANAKELERGIVASVTKIIFYIAGTHWILGNRRKEDDELFFGTACGLGFLQFVEYFVNEVPDFNFGGCRNLGIKISSRNGHYDIVRLLLTCDNVNPGDENDLSVDVACQNNHVSTVKLLLAHSDVDPTTDDDFALCVAVQNKHPEVVKIVIRCPNVSPAADRNFSIKEAISSSHVEITKMLLTGDGVRLHAYYEDPFYATAKKGNPEMMKVLLAAEDFPSKELLDDCLEVAGYHRHFEVMKVLILCDTYCDYFLSDGLRLIIITDSYDFVSSVLEPLIEKQSKRTNTQFNITLDYDLMVLIFNELLDLKLVKYLLTFGTPNLTKVQCFELFESSISRGFADLFTILLACVNVTANLEKRDLEECCHRYIRDWDDSLKTLRIAQRIFPDFIPEPEEIAGNLGEDFSYRHLMWLLSHDDVKVPQLEAALEKLGKPYPDVFLACGS